MKFICLAYEEEEKLNALSPEQWRALRDETLAWVERLRAEGRLLAAEPLRSARTARMVRMREGKLLVTDGPFAETKEQLGGFFLIVAADLDEAIQIAAQVPSARFGSIEVRPIESGLPENCRYSPVS